MEIYLVCSTTTGQQAAKESVVGANYKDYWNVKDSFNFGCYIYVSGQKTGSTIFGPVNGYKQANNASLYEVGVENVSWTSIPFQSTTGRQTWAGARGFDPIRYNGFTSFGFTVRAVHD